MLRLVTALVRAGTRSGTPDSAATVSRLSASSGRRPAGAGSLLAAPGRSGGVGAGAPQLVPPDRLAPHAVGLASVVGVRAAVAAGPHGSRPGRRPWSGGAAGASAAVAGALGSVHRSPGGRPDARAWARRTSRREASNLAHAFGAHEVHRVSGQAGAGAAAVHASAMRSLTPLPALPVPDPVDLARRSGRCHRGRAALDPARARHASAHRRCHGGREGLGDVVAAARPRPGDRRRSGAGVGDRPEGRDGTRVRPPPCSTASRQRHGGDGASCSRTPSRSWTTAPQRLKGVTRLHTPTVAEPQLRGRHRRAGLAHRLPERPGPEAAGRCRPAEPADQGPRPGVTVIGALAGPAQGGAWPTGTCSPPASRCG